MPLLDPKYIFDEKNWFQIRYTTTNSINVICRYVYTIANRHWLYRIPTHTVLLIKNRIAKIHFTFPLTFTHLLIWCELEYHINISYAIQYIHLFALFRFYHIFPFYFFFSLLFLGLEFYLFVSMFQHASEYSINVL